MIPLPGHSQHCISFMWLVPVKFFSPKGQVHSRSCQLPLPTQENTQLGICIPRGWGYLKLFLWPPLWGQRKGLISQASSHLPAPHLDFKSLLSPLQAKELLPQTPGWAWVLVTVKTSVAQDSGSSSLCPVFGCPGTAREWKSGSVYRTRGQNSIQN